METGCRRKFVLPCPLRDRYVKVVGGCSFPSILSFSYFFLFLFIFAPLCLSSSFRLFLITVFTNTIYIHSFSSLSYDRSKASSKASSPHSAIQSFLFHMRSLRSSNSFLRLLPCLPVTSIPPCIFPSVTRCRRQFLRKM